MGKLNQEYKLSIYTDIVELSKGKVYIAKSSLDDKIYIKKILEPGKYNIYKTIQSLSIANIPKIYEIIILDKKLIVIEEYINGNSLDEILNKSKTFPEKQTIKYILQLIDIIEKLHSSTPSIVHKDIKPSNIMINNDGVLKLIDFDISRTHSKDKTVDTHILGTYGYAAPEQFGYNQTDLRTDIYALGVTMNMMLIGKFPIEKLYRGELSKIISKCIELDPKKRFQSTDELKNQLMKKNRKYKKGSKDLKFVLPGFRSGSLIFKIAGFLWYGILTMLFLGFFDTEAISKDRIENTAITLFLFILTLLYGNFNNINSKLPILRSKNIFIKIFGYLLYTILSLIILGIIILN